MSRPKKMTVESVQKTDVPVKVTVVDEDLGVKKSLYEDRDEKTSRIMWEMNYFLGGLHPENALSDGMAYLREVTSDVLKKAREERALCAYPEPDVITLDHLKVAAFYALAKEVYSLHKRRAEDGSYPFDNNQPLMLELLYQLARMLNGMTEPEKHQDPYLQYAAEGIYLIENLMLYSRVENEMEGVVRE